MAEALTKFIDETGTNLNSFIIEKEDGTQETVKLYRNANITTIGTPLNATNMNNIVDSINNIANPYNVIINDLALVEGLILITTKTLELKEGNIYSFSNYDEQIAKTINEMLDSMSSASDQHIYIGYDGTKYPVIIGSNSIYFIPSYFTIRLKYHNPNETYNRPHFELIGFEGYNYENDNAKISYECSNSGLLKIYSYNFLLVGTASTGMDIPLGLGNSNVVLREVLYANVSQHTNPSINAIVSEFNSESYVKKVNIKWSGSSTSLKASFYIVGNIVIGG